MTTQGVGQVTTIEFAEGLQFLESRRIREPSLALREQLRHPDLAAREALEQLAGAAHERLVLAEVDDDAGLGDQSEHLVQDLSGRV